MTDLAAPVSTIAPSMKDTLAEYMFLWFGVVLEEHYVIMLGMLLLYSFY